MKKNTNSNVTVVNIILMLALMAQPATIITNPTGHWQCPLVVNNQTRLQAIDFYTMPRANLNGNFVAANATNHSFSRPAAAAIDNFNNNNNFQVANTVNLQTLVAGGCNLPPTNPTINPPSSNNLCIVPITLTASSIPAGYPEFVYHWFRNGTFIQMTSSSSLLVFNPGSYTVRLQHAAMSNCFTTQSSPIVLIELPPDGPIITPSELTLCRGGSGVLTASAILPPFSSMHYNYRWYKDGDLIKGASASTLTVGSIGAEGHYTVEIYSILSSNCVSPLSNSVLVLVNQALNPPGSQNFSSPFPPPGYEVVNADNHITWTAQTTVCNGQSAFLNHYNYSSTGQVDILTLPIYDLSSLSNSTFTFDIAYAPYDATYFDALRVEVSNNCGIDFNTVYDKSGSNLATAPATINNFVPDCSQWRTETIELNQYVGNSVLVRFVAINGYGNNLYLDNINISGTPSPGVRVEATVNLQGPFNSGTNNMNTTLSNLNMIPLFQPYNSDPWYYEGTESVESIPPNVVDWILVDVCDLLGNVIFRKAAFLRNDGVVLHTDGTVGALFPAAGFYHGNNYKIAIRHRNHLAVVSANILSLPNAGTPYNFTLPANVAGGVTQLAPLNFTYGLKAGDANADGVINYQDYNVFRNQLGFTGYVNGDFDLNGQVIVTGDYAHHTANASAIGWSSVR
ncbi:MAG: hypothetical protein IPM47_21080 [Sphingobacteriales bacterium]|nr:MAG: hypothetical protein IPM47_21080 [Sphingobacteriales bacterium]